MSYKEVTFLVFKMLLETHQRHRRKWVKDLMEGQREMDKNTFNLSKIQVNAH